MKGKIKTARRKVDKLRGATAGYVSLVDAGANETPFTAIKRKTGAKDMGIKKRKTPAKAKSAKSHKPLANTKKGKEDNPPTETMIAKMVFDGEYFASEDEVRTYLEKAEWDVEDIQIEETDDGFVARADGLQDEDFDRIGKVDTGEEGVEAYVGQREVKSEDDNSNEDADEEVETESKSEDNSDEADEEETDTEAKSDEDEAEDGTDASDDDDADDETKMTGKKKPSKKSSFLKRRKAAKAAEKVSKFDAWDAHFSKGNTLAKTLKDGMSWDGTPPGFYDVQAAFNSAVANIIGDEGIGDKQEALNKTAAMYAEIIGGLDTFFDAYLEDGEEISKSLNVEPEKLEKWAETVADWLNGVEAEADEEEAVEPETEKKSVAIDYNEVSTTVADIVKKAIDPLTNQLSEVSETVEAMSTRAPTKKAASPDDQGSAGPRKVKQKAVSAEGDDDPEAVEAARFAKSFLG